MEKASVIKDTRTGTIYWDNEGLVRNFEKILESDIDFETAKKKYPNIKNAINL